MRSFKMGKEGRELSLEESQNLEIGWRKQEALKEIGHVQNLNSSSVTDIFRLPSCPPELMPIPPLHFSVQNFGVIHDPCPCSLSPSHPFAHRTSSPLQNYAASTFRVPRICHLLWQVLPDYNLNHHNLSSALPLTPLNLVSTQQPEGTFQMLSHTMLTDHKTLQWLRVKKPRSLQWSSSLSIWPLLLLTSFPTLLSLFFLTQLVTLALLLLASKAYFHSFKSLIKCLYVNKACGDLPVQLYSPPPYIHPDPFLPCSFSNQPSNILIF